MTGLVEQVVWYTEEIPYLMASLATERYEGRLAFPEVYSAFLLSYRSGSHQTSSRETKEQSRLLVALAAKSVRLSKDESAAHQ